MENTKEPDRLIIKLKYDEKITVFNDAAFCGIAGKCPVRQC